MSMSKCPINCMNILDDINDGEGIIVGNSVLNTTIDDDMIKKIPDQMIMVEDECNCIADVLGGEGLYIKENGKFKKLI